MVKFFLGLGCGIDMGDLWNDFGGTRCVRVEQDWNCFDLVEALDWSWIRFLKISINRSIHVQLQGASTRLRIGGRSTHSNPVYVAIAWNDLVHAVFVRPVVICLTLLSRAVGSTRTLSWFFLRDSWLCAICALGAWWWFRELLHPLFPLTLGCYFWYLQAILISIVLYTSLLPLDAILRGSKHVLLAILATCARRHHSMPCSTSFSFGLPTIKVEGQACSGVFNRLLNLLARHCGVGWPVLRRTMSLYLESFDPRFTVLCFI